MRASWARRTSDPSPGRLSFGPGLVERLKPYYEATRCWRCPKRARRTPFRPACGRLTLPQGANALPGMVGNADPSVADKSWRGPIMTPIHELLNRIQWDHEFAKGSFSWD